MMNEDARIAAIEAAYAACDQNFLVVSGETCEGNIDGDLEIDGLALTGSDMVAGHGPVLQPQAIFLSFMYTHGWELTSFSAWLFDDHAWRFSYTMIFKKR